MTFVEYTTWDSLLVSLFVICRHSCHLQLISFIFLSLYHVFTVTMSYLFMCRDITVEEKTLIQYKFNRSVGNNLNNFHCQIWTGSVDRYGYGVFQLTFRGRRLALPAHRLSLFIDRQYLCIHRSYHVSHRCHNRLCFKPEHLSLEPQSVNNSRRVCCSDGICHGHRGYSRCILH